MSTSPTNGREALGEWCARELMGAKDVAEALGVKVPNLKHVKIDPVARISGGAIPVYLRADVEAEQERRRQKIAAAAE